jgi:hypothetical protein
MDFVRNCAYMWRVTGENIQNIHEEDNQEREIVPPDLDTYSEV